MIHRQNFGNSQWNCWHMVFSLSLHFIWSKRFAPSNEIKKKISIGPVCLPLNWCGVPFRNYVDLQKRSAGNIYKPHQSYDTCISCQLEIHVILTTLHESLLWIYKKKKYSTWTISSNRIHFTRTQYISFWRMEIKLLLTCTWNWHRN